MEMADGCIDGDRFDTEENEHRVAERKGNRINNSKEHDEANRTATEEFTWREETTTTDCCERPTNKNKAKEGVTTFYKG